MVLEEGGESHGVRMLSGPPFEVRDFTTLYMVYT